MFKHEPLRVVAEQNLDQIVAMSAPFTKDKSQAVRIAVSATLLKYARKIDWIFTWMG